MILWVVFSSQSQTFRISFRILESQGRTVPVELKTSPGPIAPSIRQVLWGSHQQLRAGAMPMSAAPQHWEHVLLRKQVLRCGNGTNSGHRAVGWCCSHSPESPSDAKPHVDWSKQRPSRS